MEVCSQPQNSIFTHKIMKHSILLLFSICLFGHMANGQHAASKKPATPKPFVLGLIDQIPSRELGETRALNIYLPDGYSPDSPDRYPVIYLLDGSADEDFIHVAGIVQFRTMIAAMPKSIIVGIANVDRKRDFTFPTTIDSDKRAYPTTGGSAAFTRFVEKELQPFIRKNYRTSTSSTLIGQSLGGLFATEVLLKKPELFDNYIIVSPSLWWDGESLLKAAPALWARQSDPDLQVYISVGTEGARMEDDAKQLSAILGASGKKHLRMNFVPLREENHLTILHNSVYRALMLLHPGKAVQSE